MKPRSAPLRRPDGAARLTIEVKRRKCAHCRETFTQLRPMQKACSVECAQEMARKVREKKEAELAKLNRQELRERKLAMKRRQDWEAEAQAAFNRYIRFRDLAAGHGCIDCGKPFEPQRPGGSVDAGHYLSRGSAPHLKFDERNCFAQRKNCNRPGGTTREAFRAGVVARIGLPAVEALESDQTVKHYSVEDLKEIKAKYTAKAREIERSMR
jgi:hypothetical protein